MRLSTLDEFLTKRRFSNAYVREPGFRHLYVRISRRYFNGVLHEGVLDLANIEARKPGAGAFTRLVERLHTRGLTLYVECVLQDRFAQKLLRMGFKRENMGNCFYMFADKERETMKKSKKSGKDIVGYTVKHGDEYENGNPSIGLGVPAKKGEVRYRTTDRGAAVSVAEATGGRVVNLTRKGEVEEKNASSSDAGKC